MCHTLNPWGESLELHMREEYAFWPTKEVRALGGALFAFGSGVVGALWAHGWSVMKGSCSLLSLCSRLLSVDLRKHCDQKQREEGRVCFMLNLTAHQERKLGQEPRDRN